MKLVDFSGRIEGILALWRDHFYAIDTDDPISFVICNSFTLSLNGENYLWKFPREIIKGIKLSSPKVYKGSITPPGYNIEILEIPQTEIVLNDDIVFHSWESQDYTCSFVLTDAKAYLLTSFEKDIYSILYNELIGSLDFRGIFQKGERERRKKRSEDLKVICEDILKYFPKRIE